MKSNLSEQFVINYKQKEKKPGGLKYFFTALTNTP